MAAKHAKKRRGKDPVDLAIAVVDRAPGRLGDRLAGDDPDPIPKVLARLDEFDAAAASALLIRRFDDAMGDGPLRDRIVRALFAFGATSNGRKAAPRAPSPLDRFDIERVVIAAFGMAQGSPGLRVESTAFL